MKPSNAALVNAQISMILCLLYGWGWWGRVGGCRHRPDPEVRRVARADGRPGARPAVRRPSA